MLKGARLRVRLHDLSVTGALASDMAVRSILILYNDLSEAAASDGFVGSHDVHRCEPGNIQKRSQFPTFCQLGCPGEYIAMAGTPFAREEGRSVNTPE